MKHHPHRRKARVGAFFGRVGGNEGRGSCGRVGREKWPYRGVAAVAVVDVDDVRVPFHLAPGVA